MQRLFLSTILLLIPMAGFLLIRLATFFIYGDYFSSLSSWEILFSFVDSLRFDLSILTTFLFIPILMLNLPIKHRPLWIVFWTAFMAVITLCVLAVASGDMFYFEFVKRHMGNELLLASKDFGFIVEMIVYEYWYMPLLFIPLSYGVYKGYRALIHKFDLNQKSWWIFILLFPLLFITIRGNFDDKPIHVIDAFSNGNVVQGNLTLNGVFTSYHYIRKSGSFSARTFFTQDELNQVLGLEEANQFPYEQKVASSSEGKNVVFILLESWSAKYIDALSHNNYGVTPNFDALASQGEFYTNFYATGQRSIQGIQASLTSIPPFSGLPTLGTGLEVYDVSKIANMARELSYETLFVQSSKRRSFRMDAIANALGFEHYFGMEDMQPILDYPNPKGSKFGWDYETLMLAKEKIDKFNKPFFTYIFTGTTHVPYPYLPKQFEKYEHSQNSEEGFLNTLYYADWAVGEFMKEAEKMPWYENTVFIFTADHCLGAFSNGSFLDKFHTPFLIFEPSKKQASINRNVASQLDIMPTIASLIGYEKPFSALGTNLRGEHKARAVLNENNTLGFVTNQGYIRDTLEQVVESNIENEDVKHSHEKRLHANYQLINTLLKENRWSR
jgi:phosphoglycerol transferase MdoB-like AlkP superfamily enzyme